MGQDPDSIKSTGKILCNFNGAMILLSISTFFFFLNVYVYILKMYCCKYRSNLLLWFQQDESETTEAELRQERVLLCGLQFPKQENNICWLETDLRSHTGNISHSLSHDHLKPKAWFYCIYRAITSFTSNERFAGIKIKGSG